MPPPFKVYRGPVRPTRGTPARRIVLAVLGTVFLVLVVFPWLASFATDWLWFKEIHFESVFLRSLIARALLFVVTGGVAFVFIYGNWRWALPGVDLPTLIMNPESGVRLDVARFSRKVTRAVAAIGAVVAERVAE